MAATGSAELAINIKKSKEQERPSGDPREPGADPIVQRNSKPGDEHAEECGKEHVARAGQRCHANCFVPVPALRPGRDDEGEPVRGNGRVKKSDTESRQSDCGKNRFVHEAQNPIIIRTILEHGEEHQPPAPPKKREADQLPSCQPEDEDFGWRFSHSWEKSGPMGIYLQEVRAGSFNRGAFYLRRASL